MSVQRGSSSEPAPPPPPPAPPKHACRVGLYNQGATCYLNSLLQLLFHTTYFRSAVYQMSTDTDDLSQIPKALQLLFFQMQERDSAIETKVLTDTFGWDNGEVLVQQDIHELATLLRENLENKMKGSRAEGAVNRLFTGVSEKYFACLDKSYTSRMREVFYDIQLQVQGFGDLVSSLKSLLVVEQLTGSNKYKVEEEGKPAVYKDAETGTRFLKFPPVLVCHLKRIDIDLESPNLDQKKINSPFNFPDELDLREYEAGLPDDYNVKVGLDESNSPAVYDLYGVIVHRGGVRSGHYFCYLRQYHQAEGWGDWVEYDDESVQVVDHHVAVVKNFGEYVSRVNAHGYTVQALSPQNAYILAYVRRGETPKVLYEERTDNIPTSVKDEFKVLMKQEEEARREAEIAGRRVHVGFFTDETIDKHVRMFKVDIGVGREPVPTKEFLKADPVSTLIEYAATLVKSPPSNIRLWLCENRGTQAYGHGWRLISAIPLPRGSMALSNTIAEEVSPRLRSPLPAGPWNIAVYVEVARPTMPPLTTNAAFSLGQFRATSAYSSDDDPASAVRDIRVFRFDPRDPNPAFVINFERAQPVDKVTFRVTTSTSKSSNAFRCDIRVISRYKRQPVAQSEKRIELSPQRSHEFLEFPVGCQVDEVEIQRRNMDVVYQYSSSMDPFALAHVQVHVPPEKLWTEGPPKPKLEFGNSKAGGVLVQVKYFNHELDTLTYAGSCMLPGVETLRASLPILINLTGAPNSDKMKLTLLEERSKTETVEFTNLDAFPGECGLRTGAILIVQQAPEQIPLCFRHPRADAFLRTVADTRHIAVRSIETPDKVVAVIPMQMQWYYVQVVDAIGKNLNLKADYLRFYCSSSFRHPKPREEPERADTQEKLHHMMQVQQMETSDLWFEVLPMLREEFESYATGAVVLADEKGNPVAPEVKFQLPNSATAYDVVSLVMKETSTPWHGAVALLMIMDKCIKQHIVVWPQSHETSPTIHHLFRQRAGRTFEVRPYTPPAADEMTFHIAIGQYQASPIMHGTPFLLNLPVSSTASSVVDILLKVTNTTPEELGDKYPVMMYTSSPLYFPDESPLKAYWDVTPGGRSASLMLNKKRPKEKPGSRYVSYNDVALSLEKKPKAGGAGPRKSGSQGGQGESP